MPREGPRTEIALARHVRSVTVEACWLVLQSSCVGAALLASEAEMLAQRPRAWARNYPCDDQQHRKYGLSWSQSIPKEARTMELVLHYLPERDTLFSAERCLSDHRMIWQGFGRSGRVEVLLSAFADRQLREVQSMIAGQSVLVPSGGDKGGQTARDGCPALLCQEILSRIEEPCL